jgi:hypothetical protein
MHAKSLDLAARTLCGSILFQLSITKMSGMGRRFQLSNRVSKGRVVGDLHDLPEVNEGDLYER